MKTQPDCLGEVVLYPPPAQPEKPSSAPAWIFMLVAVVALGLFELWALKTGHPTPSHVLQKFSAAHWWAKFVGGIGLFLLWWHLFLRGPL